MEGYLRERPEINTDWFARAAQGLGPASKARVAVRLLKEGEISNAEFLKLVHADVVLHAIETASEYPVEIPENAAMAPIVYLLKISERSLRQEHAARLEQLQKDVGNLTGEEKAKKVKEMFDYILSADPWAQAKAKVLQDPHSIRAMTGEKHVALVEEIANRAMRVGVDLEPEEKQAMEQYLAFWRARIAGSKTMILATASVADMAGTSVVAMIVGAAHTEGMCSMLRDADRPFAVVTPLSLANHEEKGDLSWDNLQSKYKRLSVYPEGFTAILLNAFPTQKQKKPEPVLSENWFQGKAELYLLTERIALGVLGPPAPPNGGVPPYGFSDDAFKGRHVSVDPRRILIIADSAAGKGRTVLFPATLNPSDPTARTEIWAKAGLGTAQTTEQERESIESMLKKALEEVQAGKEPGKKAEDKAGRIQITLNTVASYARTQEDARKVVIGAI